MLPEGLKGVVGKRVMIVFEIEGRMDALKRFKVLEEKQVGGNQRTECHRQGPAHRFIVAQLLSLLFVSSVQIFGLAKSQSTRAAERFFKERRIQIHFVDLAQKPMSPGEIRRFIERYTLPGLLDREGKAFVEAGLQYLKVSDDELLERINREPRLLRLPLVRAGARISIGLDEAAWKEMTAA
jgi:arsenate reductase-like glutaredoxin family protein